MTTFDKKRLQAPRPTGGALFWRTFLPWQLWRFAVINLRMIGLIRKSHGHGAR